MNIFFFSLLLLTFSALQGITHKQPITNYEQELINHVKTSIAFANKGYAHCSKEVFTIEDWTSNKVQRLLNNLCSLYDATFLEIGVWQGATFNAAVNNNQHKLKHAFALDNWSEFDGPIKIFKQNCKTHLDDSNYTVLEGDIFRVNLQTTFKDPVTIYFYDGDHSEVAQEQAFTYYNSILAPVFIVIIDDWNWEQTQKGTLRAFKKLGYTILYEQILPARYNGDKELWWNGVYVAVIRK